MILSTILREGVVILLTIWQNGQAWQPEDSWRPWEQEPLWEENEAPRGLFFGASVDSIDQLEPDSPPELEPLPILTPEDGIRRLAEAIVTQAIADWLTARKILLRPRRSQRASALLRECEDFFLSGWYSLLTDGRGDVLLTRLRTLAGSQAAASQTTRKGGIRQ